MKSLKVLNLCNDLSVVITKQFSNVQMITLSSKEWEYILDNPEEGVNLVKTICKDRGCSYIILPRLWTTFTMTLVNTASDWHWIRLYRPIGENGLQPTLGYFYPS